MLSLPQTALVAFVTALLLSAQTPQLHKPAADATASQADSQTSTLSVQARLVVVPVVVRDKKGAVLGNLTKENFALTVDAKPQPLRYFDHDTDLPLTVGLLIDTSRSQTAALDGERKASGVFLDKLLAPAVGTRPADRAFILQFAHSAELLQDVTDSHSKLERGLKEVDGNTGGSNPPGDTQDNRNDRNDRGRGGRDASGGTVLYDAVFLAADEIQSKQPNRRALIVLTDGDDRGSKENLARSIEAAQRADTVVYAIYFKGEDHPFADRDDNGGRHGGYGGGFPGGGGYPGGSGGPSGYPGGGGGGGHRGGAQRVDGKKVLERMCSETGGRVFEVSKKNTLDVIYAQIGEELRQGYRLAFTPPAAEDEGYHRIDVTLTGPPAKDKPNIQTRDGYYTAEK